jgi:UDP-glucose:glycoprotein glucosyltransferase
MLSAEVVGMASSVVSSSQLPDASEIGLFDAPLRPRQRSYQLLDLEHTYAAIISLSFLLSLILIVSSCFEFGNNSTALYHIAVLLDPLSETAQKWSSILEV